MELILLAALIVPVFVVLYSLYAIPAFAIRRSRNGVIRARRMISDRSTYRITKVRR